MIVYEVNLDVAAGIAAAYRAWLDAHVRTMLALPGFSGARVFEVLEPQAPAARVALSVQYTLTDQPALDAYLRDHAARMRAEGVARFGAGVRSQRRVLRDTGAA